MRNPDQVNAGRMSSLEWNLDQPDAVRMCSPERNLDSLDEEEKRTMSHSALT
jgi:hypothetical protein